MSLLRIYCPLGKPAQRCAWTLIGNGNAVNGEGLLAQLPTRAQRVEVVLPAHCVMIARSQLPESAKRRAGSVLAYAIEEQMTGEPDLNQVCWLGSSGDTDVLAVVDRQQLRRWLDALEAVGLVTYDVCCEGLLLPWKSGEWSVAWDGREGFMRTSALEAAATDSGDRLSPPVSLRLALDEAIGHSARPAVITIHSTAVEAAPDVAAWQRELGVPVRRGGTWDWRTAAPNSAPSLLHQRKRWQPWHGMLARLRPAAAIAGIALAIHLIASVADWAMLATEHRALRQQMETRFRAAFPEALAVVDPALQMRRKLAEARHAAGLADGGDFLPMVERIANELKSLPAGSPRVASYESGRLTLEMTSVGQSELQRIKTRLTEAGLFVETSDSAKRTGSTTVILVRAP